MATHLASLYDRLGPPVKGVPPPVLTTGRLVLRPLRRSDAGPVELHCGEARLARMTASIPHPYPPGAALAFIEGCATMDQSAVWAIDGSPSGLPELVGTVGLRRPDGAGESEIGYWVAPPLWGRGIAGEAVRTVLQADPFGAPIHARVFRDNPASARVLEAAGFERVGEGSDFSVARGEAAPNWLFVLPTRDAA